MSKKNEKSYLTNRDCLKIIGYFNDLYDALGESYLRHQQLCYDFIYYQCKCYNLLSSLQSYIMSLNYDDDSED